MISRKHIKNLNANVRARPDVTFWAVESHSPRVPTSFSYIHCVKHENTIICKRISWDSGGGGG